MTIKEVLLKVGDRIREGRRKKDLTQTELGIEIGYSMNGIAKIERGESDPKLSSLLKIASALNLDIDYLVGSDKQSQVDILVKMFAEKAEELAKLQGEKGNA